MRPVVGVYLHIHLRIDFMLSLFDSILFEHLCYCSTHASNFVTYILPLRLDTLKLVPFSLLFTSLIRMLIC